jgi:pimeloyl-ACP methyl ester carboxylesterase
MRATSEGIMADRSALGERGEVRVPNGTVVYHERGEGEPVVFVHGFLVDATLWRKVVPLVAQDARCIAPDWPFGSHRVALEPGADMTTAGLARHIVDTLDALGIERATLVGNDSGGALSQVVATTYPDRVARLILTNCDAFENFPPKFFRYLNVVGRVPGGLTAMAQTMRLPGAARSPIAFGWLSKSKIPGDVLKGWTAGVIDDKDVRRDAAKLLRGLDMNATLDAAAKLGAFEGPALLTWGRDDRFFPYEHAERLAQILPDARLVGIDDARTFVSEDQPEAVAAAIRDFLRETSSSPASQLVPSSGSSAGLRDEMAA